MSMRTGTMSPSASDIGGQSLARTIFASAAGTMIEWYDFYIFGSLTAVIASKFYHTGTPLALLCGPSAQLCLDVSAT